MIDQPSRKGRGPVLVVGVIAVVAVCLIFTPARSLVRRFLGSLRVQKVQAVNVDLSTFLDPNANPTLHQMIGQMVSDKVVVTTNENEQQAPTAAAASQLAGFKVRVVSKRTDAPQLTVQGEHAFNMNVDRARLQAVFNEAGRSDLVLPEALDGAAVAVQIPRSVTLQYGNCPTGAQGVAGPPPVTTQFANCLILSEGPSPIVSVPPSLKVEQLAETGLQLAGMSPSQAHEFCQAVNWKSTLGMSLPRHVQSYEMVDIKGSQGTLLNTTGWRGPNYRLIWLENGIVYSLAGFGNSGEAVPLADSLQ
jgi:hypothetical protein